MSTLITIADGNFTGATTFAAAETGAGALNLVRNTNGNIGAAASLTSPTFTVTSGKVIDAVLLWVLQSTASSTGTFKIDLQKGGVSQASVTVNKTDLPPFVGNIIPFPVLFKLTSTTTGDGGANWTIVMTTTGNGTIQYYATAASAGFFTRALRTTTTQAPAAADDLYIVGELTGAGTKNNRTVTMDSTAATAYGNGALNSTTVAGGGIHVSNWGTLSYATAGNTVLRVNGDVMVYQFGTLTMGSSAAGSGFTALNPSDKDSHITLSGGNLTATGTAGWTGLARAVDAKSAGKFYWETTFNATQIASGVGLAIGSLSVATQTFNNAGTGKCGLIQVGNVYVDGANFITVGGVPSSAISFGTITSGTVICIAVDLTAQLIWWRLGASGNWNNNASYNPTTGTGGVSIPNVGTTYPTDCFGGADTLISNFGASAFIGAVPSGFTSGWTIVMPASTAILEFQQASADGDFGLRCLDNSTVTITGQPRTVGKNVVQCKLSSNLAAAGTTLNVNVDTGWLSGDQVCIASTTRTASECELVTLSANAGASSFTTGAVTNAHSGTSPTQAEVGNITRNVKIRSTSNTLMSYVYCTALSTVTASWAEFYYFGTNAVGKRGIEVDGGAVTNPKSFTYCSLHDLDLGGLYCNASSVTSLNVTFSNSVFWLNNSSNPNGAFFISGGVTNTDWTFDSNLMMRTSSIGMSLGDVGGVCTNNTVVGALGGGFIWNESSGATVLALGSISNNTAHSGAGVGFYFSNGSGGYSGTVSNCTAWRHSSSGVSINLINSSDLWFVNLTLFGNPNSSQGNFSTAICDVVNIRGGLIAADTGFAAAHGFVCGTSLEIFNVSSVDMSGSGSIYAPHTISDFFLSGNVSNMRGSVNNCKFGAPNLFGNTKTIWTPSSYLSFQKYNQTAGDHRTEMTFGQLRTDSSVFNTASPSMRMTPNTAGIKLESAPLSKGIQVAVNSGDTVTAKVWLRKDSTYTGAQPRLIVRANAAIGINTDTVLATYASGTGSWNQITGTTLAATDNGVAEFIVDCDGASGFINVDDWLITTGSPTVTFTCDMTNWFNGLPIAEPGASAGGGGAYFSAGFV